ncbi:asparaginase [Natribacillus halophilus]|uniref:asparaginase n=1 Tax=Natribacillus halophilus TaxID=549003 RepID=A0A1G8JDX6_9BACI|nr:asparaginase [Natribacillus halophilus]SDI29494.1 L-asparaginase [Natribacillus halophilus]
MKKIALVTTGGTIASKETNEGRLRAGERSGEELIEMCGVPFDLDLKVVSLFNKPSAHLGYEDLWQLRITIEELLYEEDIAGVVITSGTDTLEEVAYFLDLTLDNEKPVAVTGSQRGPDQVGSDAFVNLRNAMIATADKRLTELGPVVIFNERIFSAKYVRKAHASNVQGFNTLGYGYFGIIDNDRVNLFQRPLGRDIYKPQTHITSPRVQVEIVKVHFGTSPALLQYLLQLDDIDAIVLEGLGRGQVPPSFMPVIAGARIPIVITTSAEEGEVYPVYEYAGSTYDLLNHGVILGKDYSSRKAKMKLYVLLETGVTELEEAFRK